MWSVYNNYVAVIMVVSMTCLRRRRKRRKQKIHSKKRAKSCDWYIIIIMVYLYTMCEAAELVGSCIQYSDNNIKK